VRRVVDAQELERKRLARELHDETGQALTSILLGLKPLEQNAATDEEREAAAALRELVVRTLQDVRRLAVELRPSALDDFGLVPALERLIDTFRERAGVAVDLEVQIGDDRLATSVETALYRIVQEGLTNIVKHADANHVSIILVKKGGNVSLLVEDDGAGFDPNADDGGLGLVGMRERVALVGGRLRIESTPGSGSTLVAEVPVQ
jgi:signal transduction histidine kinase